MAEIPGLVNFKQGLMFLRDRHPAQAVECFRDAVELAPTNPVYLSFLGLSLARAEKKWKPALEFCEAALRMKRNEARLYVNLAEVYVSTDQREKAVQVLDAGLRNIGDDPRIKRMRNKLGRRHHLVLPFLDRQHLVNRSLGKCRHRAVAYLRGLGRALSPRGRQPSWPQIEVTRPVKSSDLR
jgi:tetratricopeptide (TPR) repeat protein